MNQDSIVQDAIQIEQKVSPCRKELLLTAMLNFNGIAHGMKLHTQKQVFVGSGPKS